MRENNIMLDNTDFTQRELKEGLRNAFQSKKISCDEYEKMKKNLMKTIGEINVNIEK